MADNIVLAKYKADVKEALESIDRLEKKVEKLDKDTKKSSKDMQSSFTSAFTKIGAAAGIAFGTQQLVQFGKEAVNVAAQFEGVERAFKRIGGANSANLLQGLRNATRGTVSDLQLMQKAVQASNFKIPLENLASLFKFAQARARETGESVEYLTNSIVLGIGRKSPLILDNLGISAVELRERLKGVGVEASSVGDIAKIIGDIAEEELKKMGDQADTTADKLEKINAVMENMKVVAGEALINFATGIAYLFGQVDTGIETTDGLIKAAENLASVYENDVAGAVDKMIQKNQELLDNQLEIARLEDQLTYTNSIESVKNIRERIEAIKERNTFLSEYIKRLKEIYDESQKADPIEKEQIKNLAYYNQLIKDLQDEQKGANTTRERVRQLEDEINEAVRQRNLLLGKLTKEQKEQIELEERLRKIREISWTQMSSIGYPVTRSLTDTLAGLNRLLKEQQQILNNAPEFSKQYNDAANSIDRLKKKIKEFSDSQIDPNEGFPEFAPGGEMSATGQGLLPDPKTLEIRLNESLNLFRGFAGSVQSIYASIAQMQQNAFIRQEQELQRQLEQGLITREQYDAELDKIRQKQAAANKDAAIFQATISTAQAVVAALGSIPFSPANIALAATIGAAGAAQIAAIASQPLPQFAEGGWVTNDGKLVGRSHAQGGIRLEAEGGEYIINKIQSKKHADLIESINAGKVEDYIAKKYIIPTVQQIDGQMAGMAASAALNGFNDMNLLRAFDRNRQAEKANAQYIVKGVVTGLSQKRSRWN